MLLRILIVGRVTLENFPHEGLELSTPAFLS
jgi:hypothetical protein